jgi:oligoendopeptidase F
MTIAETSSIFFETVFIDFIIQNENDPALKKSLIGWKIERSLNYVLSIRGAFLFEKSFNEQRLKGPLSASQIEELSLQSQEVVYGGSLSSYEPFVWMKYEQFYQTDIPFYNYPYTFGFLLSLGLLDVSKEKQFAQQFHDFLRETGTLPIENLVNKHFAIDLSTPYFWQQSVKRILNDIEQYSRL